MPDRLTAIKKYVQMIEHLQQLFSYEKKHCWQWHFNLQTLVLCIKRESDISVRENNFTLKYLMSCIIIYQQQNSKVFLCILLVWTSVTKQKYESLIRLLIKGTFEWATYIKLYQDTNQTANSKSKIRRPNKRVRNKIKISIHQINKKKQSKQSP
jgi:hypothetical protein